MRNRWFMLATALLAALTTIAAAPAEPPGDADTPSPTGSALAGLDWIVDQQVADGGFFRPDQSVAYSGGLAETLAVVATDRGASADTLERARDRLARLGPEAATRPAYTGRIVSAITAAGDDPRAFGGHDYVAQLEEAYRPVGFWEHANYANALAALGWLAAGRDLPPAAVAWIRANQCLDGGFSWQSACAFRSDIDTTALIINVLAAHGLDRTDPTVAAARAYLLQARNDQGGFGAWPGQETNANSTGLALSAIAALGESPTEAPWSLGGVRDPLTQLLALQTQDGGFLWRAGDPGGINSYATVQAVPGVAGLTYPLEGDVIGCERPGQGHAAPASRGAAAEDPGCRDSAAGRGLQP